MFPSSRVLCLISILWVSTQATTALAKGIQMVIRFEGAGVGSSTLEYWGPRDQRTGSPAISVGDIETPISNLVYFPRLSYEYTTSTKLVSPPCLPHQVLTRVSVTQSECRFFGTRFYGKYTCEAKFSYKECKVYVSGSINGKSEVVYSDAYGNSVDENGNLLPLP